MNEEERGLGEQFDLGVPGATGERAILVGLLRRQDRESQEAPLEELARLAETAGVTVLDRMVQARERVSARAYIGRGKVTELLARVRELEANLVVVDDDLAPAQARHLTDDLNVRVIDRSELILDIFAQRARTKVAKAEVELAQLEYLLPRLPHLWEHLSRLGGGVGTRGPGETQLEVDRRRVRERIGRLRRILDKVESDWHVQRKAAREHFSVALVGYTNSGKSTLMNALTGAGVGVGDRLFETLDTTTRVWEPAPGVRLLLSDTVGFIRRLPHRLIDSFHATLGEVREADLLLHVVDMSHPEMRESMRTVETVLEEIGVAEKQVLAVFNKKDRVEDDLLLARLSLEDPSALAVSALTSEGLPELAAAVLAIWEEREVRARVTLPQAASRALAALHRHGRVEQTEADENALRLTVRIPPRWLRKIGGETEGMRWEPATDGRPPPEAPD